MLATRKALRGVSSSSSSFAFSLSSSSCLSPQVASFALRLFRALEKWTSHQDACGLAVNSLLNLLIQQQYLQGDYLITLQTWPEARRLTLEGHARRMEKEREKVSEEESSLDQTIQGLEEISKELQAFQAKREGRCEGKECSLAQTSSRSIQSISKASSGVQTPGHSSEDCFVMELANFTERAIEVYRQQLELQRRLNHLIASLSPFDRDEMERILAIYMDRPCELAIANERKGLVGDLKKRLRLSSSLI
ncbi:awp1 [Cystoisospora suis]|uniref:Awp1 n=1 Tax=Cystoisospora suis TaxID=483139 RepID=A0A2C6LEL9_9APIC|nr:awp1 [Cystoisospora suis]